MSTFFCKITFQNEILLHHDKLKLVLNELTDFCFRGGDKKYISVNSNWANWVDEKGKIKRIYSKTDIKTAISYLLDNCFFTFGKLLFRQIIGIPMGSDPAPFMANLFLLIYFLLFL